MVLLSWFSVLLVLVLVPLLFSHSLCLHDFHLRLGSYVDIFFFICLIVCFHFIMFICHFGFKEGAVVLTLVIAFPFTFVKYFYLFLDGYTYLTRKSQNRKSYLLKLVFSG